MRPGWGWVRPEPLLLIWCFWREPENVTDCRRRFNCYRRCRSENGFLTEFIKNSPFESENGECAGGTGWSAAFCLLLQQFGYIQCCTVFYFDHFMIFDSRGDFFLVGLFRFVNHAGEVALQNDFFGEIMANLIFLSRKKTALSPSLLLKSILPLALSWKSLPACWKLMFCHRFF